MTYSSGAIAVLGTITALVVLPGCTENEAKREFAVPKSACGTPIDADDLSAFLPPGKKLTTKTTSDSRDSTKCAISVDSKLVVQTAQEWWDDMTVVEFSRGMTLDDPDHQTDDGNYVYSDYQAFGKVVDCQSNAHKGQVLYTAIQGSGSDHRDLDAMKRLIEKYTQAVKSSEVCS
ncbi:hypothetical protein ACIQAC_29685 [Streptomyces sp. NPDC088387]|uniref:hypothetical protein n=1 Tax=Streptomyces sp. NPDC088387 TaxID=3365859 RepID=UPI003819A859